MIHRALPHPEMLWSRNRSLMIVKSTISQAANRKISSTVRSPCPKV